MFAKNWALNVLAGNDCLCFALHSTRSQRMSTIFPDLQLDLAFAQKLDQHDPLRSFRSRFLMPTQENGEPYIYLCGNSLGCQPKGTRAYVEQELEDWARLGVEGHVHARKPWLPYHEFLTDASARIVGAKPEEVVVMNTLTVNLHLLMVSFYRPTAERPAIMIEADAFPSDIYAVKSQLAFHGYDPESDLIMLRPREGEHALRESDILKAIAEEGQRTALIMFGGVNYYTGQCFPMEAITSAGHEMGCVVGFDLAHAAGNVPLDLHAWGVDFAAWCGYKYLNGGPGGASGVYIHERHHQDRDLPRFHGWWGHDKATRFQMEPEFEPIPTAEAWQLSNAPVLSMAALRASLDIFDEAGMPALREKALRQTDYLLALLDARPDLPIEVITPPEAAARGGQLSLLTGEGGKVMFDRLTAAGVICDWREPNVIRIATAPLYNRYEDLWHFMQILANQA